MSVRGNEVPLNPSEELATRVKEPAMQKPEPVKSRRWEESPVPSLTQPHTKSHPPLPPPPPVRREA
ncbi:hypothetical protein E2C01_047553 [Portunus trituberculatus]|uniref:Uncharacterized protein n=1 Tax=Portunus trituberculatus TaxID=210409 RepID=A0A5B7G893_PORTR|nr:hypothetical protein [Portunus trituberculatus]